MKTTRHGLLESRQVYARTGIPKASLTYWALRAGVVPEYQEIRRGHVFNLWPPEIVQKIRKARNGRAAGTAPQTRER